MITLQKKSGKISKTQILAIVMMVLGYALTEAIEYGLITNPKVATWLMSVFGFVLMIVRSYTSEPLITQEQKRLNKKIKEVMKVGFIVFSVSSCTTVDCGNRDILFDIYDKRIEARCSDGTGKVTLSTSSKVTGDACVDVKGDDK